MIDDTLMSSDDSKWCNTYCGQRNFQIRGMAEMDWTSRVTKVVISPPVVLAGHMVNKGDYCGTSGYLHRVSRHIWDL